MAPDRLQHDRRQLQGAGLDQPFQRVRERLPDGLVAVVRDRGVDRIDQGLAAGEVGERVLERGA